MEPQQAETYKDLQDAVNPATEETKPQVNVQVVMASDIKQEAFHAGLLQGATLRAKEIEQVVTEVHKTTKTKHTFHTDLIDAIHDLLAKDAKQAEEDYKRQFGITDDE